MKWLMLTVVMALTMQSAYAEITDSNVVDHLIVEKTKAQALVLQLKTQYEPRSPEYNMGRQKYTAAQVAFNNYIRAMLNNYKAGNRIDLSQSADLAASRAKDFENYVSGLDIKSRGFSAVFLTVGILLEVGEKLYNFVQKLGMDGRTNLADSIAPQVSWDEWNQIGS